MASAEFKELEGIILEQKMMLAEIRDGGNQLQVKKDMEALSAEYKKLKDAVAAVEAKVAMQTVEADAEPEYKALFDQFARKAVVNNTVVGPQGGFLVPKPMYDQIMLRALEDNVIRQGAEILTTSAGSLDIPVEENTDSVELIGELEDKPEAPVYFSNVHINIFDFNRDVPVTKQLIDDSAFDVESFIVGHIGRRIAVAEENTFLNGQSPKSPEGILKAGGLDNDTAAGAAAVTIDDLVNMRLHTGVAKSSVLDKSVYLMHPATLQSLYKLKDSQNRPIVLPIGEKMVPAFNGYPVKTSTAMPIMAANNKSVVFGDLSAYKIVDRMGIEIQRNPYKKSGVVYFEFSKRVGGAVGDRTKLVTLTMHA